MCRIEDQSTQLGVDSAELELIQSCGSKMLKHIHANLERESGDQQQLLAKQDYLSNLLERCDTAAATS